MDREILKYQKELTEIALSFIDKDDLVVDVCLAGSRAGDWYVDESDIDIMVCIDKDFKYNAYEHMFCTKFKEYDVEVFFKSKEELGVWRGLRSPYYSFYTGEYNPGNAEDVEWLRTHKPDLRERKKKAIADGKQIGSNKNKVELNG